MSDWDKNPYYYPENMGLEILTTLDDYSLSYEFDMFVVWKSIDGDALYYASDSGCSCPSPFEDYTSVSDLNKLDSYFEFEKELNAWNRGYGDREKVGSDEITRLLSIVSAFV